MFSLSLFRPVAALAVVAVLAACQSSEERAEGYYQNALQLIAEGDTDRAMVEFRNVFQHNGQHREARRDLAELLRADERLQEAYGQYLRLVEQYPDDVEGRVALAEMAIGFQSWEDAFRHGDEAVELAPDDPRVAVIAINLDYARAIENEDELARAAAYEQAQALVAEHPDDLLLRRILVDDAVRAGNADRALTEVDAALELAPNDRALYNTRLGLLAQLERAEDVELLLQDMIARFPEDEDLTATLLRFYVSRGQIDEVESYLREIVTTNEDPDRRRDAQTALVQLLLQQEGTAAALTELDTIIAAGENVEVFGTLRAGILFDTGDREEAITEMETILASIPEEEQATEQTGRIRVALAQMLLQSGNHVGARALVDEVLAADEGQVDALKMRAGWLIDEDETAEAIGLLRRAIDENPQDAEALTLMAVAHDRNGTAALANEFLALAVEASNAAPEESIRYANRLMANDSFLAAEEVLIDSLRLAPNNLTLLSHLGELYIRMEDWSRAEQVEETLRRVETEQAVAIADRLQATRLAVQGRLDDAIAFLEELAAEGDADLGTQVSVIRARLANGQEERALSLAEAIVEEAPDNLTARYVLAATQAALGQYEDAVGNYRLILETQPLIEQVWTDLVRALYAQGDLDGADAALAEGLETLPEGLSLLWAQASFMEQRGELAEAIAIYEMMYERAPGSPVVANNLASLLTTYNDDAESLERAYTIARRLRDSDFAPFQDTYGWIAYRRGDYAEALAHLEPAAAELTDDPLVQFHLAMTYVALDRPEDALERFRVALDLAGPDDDRAQFDTARSEITRLEAEATAETTE
ncbi:tetratricopeptide repeat protein [Gymnodinialimonas sp. 2305UL16-5]|uniref:tetratricopeptide repeat protein n=1 Tax=Gymnodinialimonas mytili TaxID=3126503 RepID=UPI0030A6D757